MTATMTTTPPQAPAKEPSGRKAAPAPVGLPPRVSLMPPELGERNKQLAVQRGLRLLMVFVAALVVAAIVGAWYLSLQAAIARDAEIDRTAELQAQRLGYQHVQEAMDAVTLGAAGVHVGGSTEIDLLGYLSLVAQSLPEGVRLDTFSLESQSITTLYPQSQIPLEGPRIGTLTFTAVTDGLPRIPVWLDSLAKLPGFVDAVPGSVVLLNEGGYTVDITLHLNSGAYTNRMAEEAERATELRKGPAASDEDEETDE